jgi:hypothetical protein
MLSEFLLPPATVKLVVATNEIVRSVRENVIVY